MTTPDDRAACTGLSALFDSTHPADHRHARTICQGCDVIAACRQNLRDEMWRVPGGRPTGTWAGRLFTLEQSRTSGRTRGVA